MRARLRRLVPRGTVGWIVATVAALALAFWVFGAVALGSKIFHEHNAGRAQWKCERPAGVFGTSTWQPWPPGRVCHYADGTIAAPSNARAVVLVMLAVTAVVGVVIAFAYAHRKGAFAAEEHS